MAVATAAAGKTVGEKYKKHELRDHIYVLPDSYVGSIEPTPIETYLYDDVSQLMTKREITYVPGLYKIFDEIIVNAIDQSMRLKSEVAAGKEDVKPMKNLWITVDQSTGVITVINDGDGIDIDRHPEHKVWIPELIFGELLTSTNYDTTEEKLWGGKNGYGSKLTNIFSKEFIVETIDHRRKKIYTQRFFDNMKSRDAASVRASSKAPYTKITFKPDYERFGLKKLGDDMYALFRKRAYDACATTDTTVNVYFNGTKLLAKDFEKYSDLYLGGKTERVRVYEASGDGRWEVVATYSDHGQFESVSFVNGINTLRGGKHVEYITNQITKRLVEMAAKKKRTVKPQHIKDNLMIFVKALIVNPAFDSQSKETLTTQASKFGSKCELSDKFMDKLYKSGVADRAISLTEFHDDKKMAKTDGKKQSRIFVPKLDDANFAGTKNSGECTLILTEGDSAKTMAIAGLSVVGRDKYGVFPLRGKILNVKDAAKDKIAENAEITALKKIIGLEQGRDYKDITSLRYGHIMLLCDQDVDGSHIKGLLFNVFGSLWPSLLRTPGFLISMLTPIVKVSNSRTKEGHSFYNLTDFAKWRDSPEAGTSGWHMKYFKGLGTSTSVEAKEYFKELKKTVYEYTGPTSDEALDLAFNKKRADDRKAWLMAYDRSKVLDYKNVNVPYEEFVDKDLIHFSNRDLERSINNLCDGLKESTRKIMFGCFKKRLFSNEIRVAQLSGYISEVAVYHHGETSLQQAIIGMAQDFVGSNNINLLSPNGQFGTRIQGGADAASPRYIHTLLSPMALKIYREEDNPILKYLCDDGTPIEPEFYIPIIPMILVNGGLGIGTGFSTNVPCHNPGEVADMCFSLLNALDAAPVVTTDGSLAAANKIIDATPLKSIKPWYQGFTGSITPHKEGSFVSRGGYRFLDDTTVEVTELPVGTWTEDYKDFLSDMIAKGSTILKDFENHYTDKKVRFVLRLYPGAREKIEDSFETDFKLQSAKNLSMNNIHLYNEDGTIQRFLTAEDIVRQWARVRLQKYQDRKAHQIKKLEAALRLLAAKCRFIQEIIDKKLRIMNIKAKEVDEQLTAGGYPKLRAGGEDADDEPTVVEGAIAITSAGCGPSSSGKGPRDYGYLTSMPIHHLTFEKKQALEEQADKQTKELAALRLKPIQAIWRDELQEFQEAWYAHKETLDAAAEVAASETVPGGTKGKKATRAPAKVAPAPKKKAPPPKKTT